MLAWANASAGAAVALGLDQIPHCQPLAERQCFQDVGNVGRMQPVKQLLQRRQVLAVHQGLDQIVARAGLAANEILHQFVTMQQLDDLLELRLDSGTGFLMVGHAQFQGRIGQLNLRPHSSPESLIACRISLPACCGFVAPRGAGNEIRYFPFLAHNFAAN